MSFKPGKYVTPKYRSSSRVFTVKGKSSSDDIMVSEEELVEILKRLKDSSHVSIKKLRGSLKDDFQKI